MLNICFNFEDEIDACTKYLFIITLCTDFSLQN